MGILDVFSIISGNLTYAMFAVLIVALTFRYLAYRAGKRDSTYFNTFTRTVEKNLESDPKEEKVHDNWNTKRN